MKKTLKIITCIILSLLCITLTIFYASYYTISNSKYTMYYIEGIDNIPITDYIVVLGASIFYNAPELYLENRLDTAIELYKHHISNKIIISGGYNDTYQIHECDVMSEYLINNEIPKEDIIIDEEGNSTYDSMQRISKYVGNQSIIICTQELYMPRTTYLAKQFNINVIGISSDIKIYSENLLKIQGREFLADTKAIFIGGFFKPNSISLSDSPFKEVAP